MLFVKEKTVNSFPRRYLTTAYLSGQLGASRVTNTSLTERPMPTVVCPGCGRRTTLTMGDMSKIVGCIHCNTHFNRAASTGMVMALFGDYRLYRFGGHPRGRKPAA
jgi:hypothetical protein